MLLEAAPGSGARSVAACVASAHAALADAGIESARLEAQLLVAMVTGSDRARVAARVGEDLSDAQSRMLADLVRRRALREPMAFLRGFQEFYGLDFEVDRSTLIPRPETELLVDFALEAHRAAGSPKAYRVADIGSGTGCIAISTLVNARFVTAIATDTSAEALELARRNAARHGVQDRIRFLHADGLSSVAPGVDLILCNPPYIPTADLNGLQPEVRLYEPRSALDGGPTGLDLLARLSAGARAVLKPGGSLAVECAMGQAESVISLFRAAGLASIRTIKDLAGVERVVCARAGD